MTDFSDLAAFLVQYQLTANGQACSDSSSALAVLSTLDAQAKTEFPSRVYEPTTSGLRAAYKYLEWWSVVKLPELYSTLPALIARLPSQDPSTWNLTSLECGSVVVPVANDWESLETGFQSDVQKFLPGASRCLDAYEKVRTAAAGKNWIIDRLRSNPDDDATIRFTEEDHKALEGEAPTPEEDIILQNIGGQWGTVSIFSPLARTITHFQRTPEDLAREYESRKDDAERASFEARKNYARVELMRLRVEFADKQRSDASTAAATPTDHGKWLDFGKANDNKLDSLITSSGMLSFAMQECFEAGGQGYGEFYDIAGNRKWRFDISPSTWTEDTADILAFVSSATGKTAEELVAFAYVDKRNSPSVIGRAACRVRLAVIGTAEVEIKRGGRTKYVRRLTAKDSDQYRDGYERVPVRYRR